jgi:16S rRNA (cytosine1402-N4)-methyltransferase
MPDGLLLGLDVDPQAIQLATDRLRPFGSRAIIVKASYATLRMQLDAQGWVKVDGILLDLGISSMQVDTPGRGFSFQVDAPLDMRFDPQNPVRAADLVNNLSEKELADMLYQYGEERRSHQVARAIVRARPIFTTQRLAEVVAAATKSGKPGIHPATRTFQALRIGVNRELETLENALPMLVKALASGGRLVVIAFHSLEDRIVKNFFRLESHDCICPPKQPICTCDHKASVREIVRHPIRPDEVEIRENQRARSARLRAIEKLPD